MALPMYIDRAEIVAVLRARSLDARADWVERSLPHLVDIRKNRSLLQMLGIDPASVPPTDVEVGPARGRIDTSGDST